MHTVESVTDVMVRVSIEHPVDRNEERLQGDCVNSLMNGEHSYSESPTSGRGDTSVGKISSDGEPLCDNVGPEDVHDTKVQVIERSKDDSVCLIKDFSKRIISKESNGNDDDDEDDNSDDDGSEVKVDDSVMDEDNDKELEQESDDSDSSSSTSALSYSSSSDDDEADQYRLPEAYMQKVEMEPESECEEGELKEPPSQGEKTSLKKMVMDESSEDGGGLKEPMQSKKEMKDLPHVPKVRVTLQAHHTLLPVGFVSSVIGLNLIVEGIEGLQPLSEGSILWLTEQKSPLGIVDELFGPVKKPFYVVRYNDTSELPEGAREGTQVSYVHDFADFVLNNPDLYAKGYDNCAENEEDLSESEVAFSDDEKEAEYRHTKSRTKRGNAELKSPDIDTWHHEERRTQGKKRFSKNSRSRRSRGENSRNFQSNDDFLGRPRTHQNLPFQHHRGEGEPSFQCRQGGRDPPFQPHQGEREQQFCSAGAGPMQTQSLPMNQPFVSQCRGSSQYPEAKHSQMPDYNGALVVGQVTPVAGSAHGILTSDNVPLQAGINMGQDALPVHQQPPIFQQVSLANQYSSSVIPPFSAQPSSNLGMQMGNQVQMVHVDGYPMRVQPATAFSAPVLGIPIGPANASSNSLQVVHNQPYSGFTPGCLPSNGKCLPSAYGVPDHLRPMQPMEPSPGTPTGPWQQQHSPQCSSWQQPYQQRSHQGKAPYRSRRF